MENSQEYSIDQYMLYCVYYIYLSKENILIEKLI